MGEDVREVFDKLDRRLSRILSEDGDASVNALASRLQISPPTVRARMKSLVEGNLLKIVGVLNVSERPELISAIIGIHANGRGRLSEIAQRMSELPFVTSVGIVTGRYDIIAEVLVEGDMEELYRVTSELLPGVAEPGVIHGSETFVVMKSHNRWLGVPKGVWEEDACVPGPGKSGKGSRVRSAGRQEGGASPALATGEEGRR
nr:Lrp/AsnC family transcriptional regulator [Paracoccus sp. S-4012]